MNQAVMRGTTENPSMPQDSRNITTSFTLLQTEGSSSILPLIPSLSIYTHSIQEKKYISIRTSWLQHQQYQAIHSAYRNSYYNTDRPHLAQNLYSNTKPQPRLSKSDPQHIFGNQNKTQLAIAKFKHKDYWYQKVVIHT